MDRASKRTPHGGAYEGLSYEQLKARSMTGALGGKYLKKVYDRPDFKKFKDNYTKQLLKERDSGAYDFRKRK